MLNLCGFLGYGFENVAVIVAEIDDPLERLGCGNFCSAIMH